MERLKELYIKHLIELVNKNIIYKLLAALFVLALLVFNDLFVLKQISSVYTRFMLIIPIIVILFIKLINKNSEKSTYYLYIIVLFLTPVMMYAKVYLLILQKNEYFFSTSVVGIIVSIFVLSLELKTNKILSALVYFSPYLIFVFILLFTVNNNEYLHSALINTFPVVIIGFVSNLYYNKYLFKLFVSNYELKEKSLIIARQNEELKAINDQKNKLFSIIAHDLKNPFNVILGFSELLDERYNDLSDEKRIQIIKEVRKASDSLYKMLDSLLKWARVQVKGVKLNKTSVNIKSLIEDIVELYKLMAEQKSIKFKIIVDESIDAKLDKSTFKIILNNLINNAVKFSFEQTEIEIKVVTTLDKIKVSVTNFGKTINKEDIPKLFDIDENILTKGTKGEKGTGLGLPLCKDLVKLNGGEIYAESKENKTIFYFTLPM